MLFILHAVNESLHRILNANFIVDVSSMLGRKEFEGLCTWA